MPSFNFQPQFKDAILSGKKPGTVRMKRKSNPIKSGDILYLFTGLRTDHCERITTKFCKTVYDVVIVQTPKKRILKINGVPFFPIMQYWFATADGFKTIDEFFEFFRGKYGSVFQGEWYVWDKAVDEMIFDYIVSTKIGHGRNVRTGK